MATDLVIFSWGRKWPQCARAAEREIRNVGSLPVDCLQLWKNPEQKFPHDTGENPACQAYVLAQAGAAIKVVHLMQSLQQASVGGAFCEGGKHRARAVATTCKQFADALGYTSSVFHLMTCESMEDVQDRHVTHYNTLST